ncbi:MAG: phage holin family protein [Deltaproteobacteria bacterium]|jgi:putative membrane protein|nr:phage holin family protein [Deltaproteobacteria bacterium]
MLGFGIRMAITAVGLWIASSWVSGIEVADTATLVWAALLLGIVNAVVRPVIVVLTLPITFLTLGLFLWVINAAMIALVASLLDGLRIAGFGSALIGALILSVTGWLGSAFIGPGGRYEMIVVRGSGLHD